MNRRERREGLHESRRQEDRGGVKTPGPVDTCGHGRSLITGILVDLSAAKPLILPLTMLMVYPMLVNFRPAQAFSMKDGRAVGVAMGLNFVIFPLLAWALASLFFSDDPGLFVGMLLVGLFPTSGMTISWTGFAKGNVAAAVKMTVVGFS